MASQKNSPIGAKSRSLSVPQDAKSNLSNGLVERVVRIIDPQYDLGGLTTRQALARAEEIHALYQQEGVLSSQRGGGEWVLAREHLAACLDVGACGDGVLAAAIRTLLDSHAKLEAASQRGENRSANASLAPDTEAKPAGWQYRRDQAFLDKNPDASEWTYALFPTRDGALHASYGGFEGRPLNTVRPLYSASPATPIGGLSVGVEGDQGASVAGLPAHVAEATATDTQHSAGKED